MVAETRCCGLHLRLNSEAQDWVASEEDSAFLAAADGSAMQGYTMHYVYLIESARFCQRYVGQIHDLKARILGHNSGNTPSTARYRPWTLVCYLGFADGRKAVAFEH